MRKILGFTTLTLLEGSKARDFCWLQWKILDQQVLLAEFWSEIITVVYVIIGEALD